MSSFDRVARRVLVVSAAAVAACVSGQAWAQTTQPVLANDVILGRSQANSAATVQQIRGNPAVLNNGTVLGSTWAATFVQGIQFDHSDGIRHNPKGNLLGLDFGTLATGGGILYNMQTNRPANAPNPGLTQNIFNIRDYNTANSTSFLESRLSSPAVSPLNNRVAMTGNDSGEMYVVDYSNGASVGSGTGASVSTLREAGNLIAGGSQTHGAVWLDNDNVLGIGHDGTLKKYTVAGANLNETVVGNIGLASGPNYFTSALYEPTLSPYVFIQASDFTATVTTNRIIVVDPNNSFAQVGSFNYSTSMNTSRAIAFDVNGNLLMSQRATPVGQSAIDTVVGGNLLANLGTNNSQDFYLVANGTNSFSGMDAAAGLLDYMTVGLTANVRDNDYMVRYFPGTIANPKVQIRQRLATGWNGGAWNGTGSAIITSDGAATFNTAIGYADAADLGLIGSTWADGAYVIGGDAILTKYTWYGDADLNGVVDFDDYVRTDGGFNSGGDEWLEGDYDYTGGVDFDDYVLIDLAFNSQNGTLRRAQAYLSGDDRSLTGMNADPALEMVVDHFGQFGTDYASHFLSAVPEPTTLGAIGVVALGAMARRRRGN